MIPESAAQLFSEESKVTGQTEKIHTLKILEWSNELPVVVEAVDNEKIIRSLVPKLREIVGKELMTMQAVEIL